MMDDLANPAEEARPRFVILPLIHDDDEGILDHVLGERPIPEEAESKGLKCLLVTKGALDEAVPKSRFHHRIMKFHALPFRGFSEESRLLRAGSGVNEAAG